MASDQVYMVVRTYLLMHEACRCRNLLDYKSSRYGKSQCGGGVARMPRTLQGGTTRPVRRLVTYSELGPVMRWSGCHLTEHMMTDVAMHQKASRRLRISFL